MMITQIVTLKDLKAGVWSTPQFVPSIGAYMRQLSQEVNTPREGNVLNTNPEDFESYHIGQYNDEDGQIELLKTPKQLCQLSNLKVTTNK